MTYCISDIHGEYDLFMRLLTKIGYSDSDRLIVCGDIVDKGNSSVRLTKTIFSLPNSYCIKGNHEHIFFNYYCSQMEHCGGNYDIVLRRLRDFFPDDCDLLDWDTVDILVDLPYYIEDKDFICVHAGIPMDIAGRLLPPDEISPEEFIYDRYFKDPEVLPKDSKCVFFGHTPTTYIVPEPAIIKYPRSERHKNSRKISNYCKIHLDTGVNLSGVLGCFCVEGCQEFYVTK